MTINEAIEYAKEQKEIFGGTHKEFLDIAIEILEKQVPKKVEIKSWCPTYCPTCGYELSTDEGDGYYRHPIFLERCPNVECSQVLSWNN